MVKSIIAVALLVAMVAAKAPMSTTSNFFWYPADNGGVVPAFLDSGANFRALTKADESDVHFWLFTLSARDGYELIVGDTENLKASPYMAGKPVKFICHGFSSSGDKAPGTSLRDAYFDAGNDYNIIIIDWKAIAAAPWYDRAAAGTKIVGQMTARLCLHMMASGLKLSDVHIMGHSLGSHVAGWAGSILGAGQLGRITAMDPALPLFGEKPDSDRIDPTDAAYVDVIHTAGGSILDGALAFTDPRGHVDFYPNDGTPPQAGCSGEFMGTCSHSRSYEFMEESIRKNTSFRSCLCNSWEEFWSGSCSCHQTANMGEGSTGSPHGRYYLVTNPKRPFSQH